MDPNMRLTAFCKQLITAPNRESAISRFNAFAKNIAFEQLVNTQDLTRCFGLAKMRLTHFADLPVDITDLMMRVEDALFRTLRVDPILLNHLQELSGESLFDKYMEAVDRKTGATLLDLFYIMGIDLGGIYQKSYHTSTPTDIIRKYCDLLYSAATWQVGTQWPLWNSCGLSSELFKLRANIQKAKEGTLEAPRLSDLHKLKEGGKVIYYPVGYANHSVFFMSLIALDYRASGYRLRLLSAESKGRMLEHILAAGSKPLHYSPEVIWDMGLDEKDLLNPRLWQALFEPATLTDGDRTRMSECYSSGSKSYPAFVPTHLVPWLTRILGEKPSSSSQTQSSLLLRPTEKEFKNTLLGYDLKKFIHLLPLDLIPDKNGMLLFKAESRLFLLVSAYQRLKSGVEMQTNQGQFLKAIRQYIGKIVAPIEKLMQNSPKEQEIRSAKTILSTVLDLKHRLACFTSELKCLSLESPTPLYPSTNLPHRIKLNNQNPVPIKQSILDCLRTGDELASVPFYACWSLENFRRTYDALEQWYEALLDAHKKCEPHEIVVMAHQNIFSQLPIPQTDRVEDTFPGELPEGLIVGTILLLKKIASLVTAEVYSSLLVPPLFIADITRLYRFSLELYRKLNPEVQKVSVSWFCLHEYMTKRHSYHAPGYVSTTLNALVSSFTAISPNGFMPASKEFQEIPLFYYSWFSLPKHYLYTQKAFGPFREHSRSVEEVLTRTELIASLGLTPEDIKGQSKKEARWETSFAGQALLGMQELGQYYTLAYFVAVDAYKKTDAVRSFKSSYLLPNTGPEDHLQLPPPHQSESISSINSMFCVYPDVPLSWDVEAAKSFVEQRMVRFSDAHISKVLGDLPVQHVYERREQAELLMVLPKEIGLRGLAALYQGASGPIELSLDIVLEYFEKESALLLNSDYRAYFLAIVRSNSVLERQSRDEPLLLDRFYKFCANLIQESDQFERLLWTASLVRYLGRIDKRFDTLLQEIVVILRASSDPRAALHVLASDVSLPIVERARLHLQVGSLLLQDPNDVETYYEAAEAMQSHAHLIQESIQHGDLETRRALWSLLVDSKEAVDQLVSRSVVQSSLATLLKTVAQLAKLECKAAYFQKWTVKLAKEGARNDAWREAVSKRMLEEVKKALAVGLEEQESVMGNLAAKARSLVCLSSSSIVTQVGGSLLGVDWKTGRISGKSASRSVYIRKHPDLAILQDALHRPGSKLSVDHETAALWLEYEGARFRLIQKSEYDAINLPTILEGFSVWESAKGALITAQGADGMPIPAFRVDPQGAVYSLHANSELTLAEPGYYPEAEFFTCWGQKQSSILVWLDKQGNVSELHLPLHNGRDRFTKVLRLSDGTWLLDGLDLVIEPRAEVASSFHGFTSYLVGRNKKNERLLLLSSTSPYELVNREVKDSHIVDWSQIVSTGAKEGISQYQIMPSGQVEGVTLYDNILLLLWKLYMGDYSIAAELARRWISPAGRAYTKEEEKLLLSFINPTYSSSAIERERHPSASAIRLYVIVRMARHVRDYPSGSSELMRAFYGNRHAETTSEINKNLMDRNAVGRQLRNSRFDELFSLYDHEASLRMMHKYSLSQDTLLKLLYERKNQTDLPAVTTALGKVCGEKLRKNGASDYWMHELVRHYMGTNQTAKLAVEELSRRTIGFTLLDSFDRAYTLIRSGGDQEEYNALINALDGLHGDSREDICIKYYMKELDFFHDEIFKHNIMLWLLLEQAYLAKKEGKELPELPSSKMRFELVLRDSKIKTEQFFTTLADYSGKSLQELFLAYVHDWFEVQKVRYFEQSIEKPAVSQEFINSLRTPWPEVLEREITRWKALQTNMEPKKIESELDICLGDGPWQQQELLKLANRLPTKECDKLAKFAREIHYKAPCTVDDCIRACLIAKSSYWNALCPETDAATLQRSTLQFVAAAVGKSTYTPSTATFPLMAAEYFTNCRLRSRPNQAELIEQLTKESTNYKGAIIQAIMGSGKSKMLAPIWAQIMLRTGRIPIISVPNPLFQTAIADLQNMMWKRFGTHVRAFRFSREECTKDRLYALAESLHIARLEPTIFVCTPSDLHALQLMLKERHQLVREMNKRLKEFAIQWARSRTADVRKFSAFLEDDNWDAAEKWCGDGFAPWKARYQKLQEELKPLIEESNLLQGILNLLQHEAALLVDEVASVYDPRNQLTFPIGWQVAANPSSYAAACKIFFEWLPDHHEIAHKAWHYYKEECAISNMPPLDVFMAYLHSRPEGEPMQLKVFELNKGSILDQMYAQEIAFIKYALTTGLEAAFSSKQHVHYGRSKVDHKLHLAIPYRYANDPNEGTIFAVWKTVILTCNHYLSLWDDPEQTVELIGFLQGVDPASKDKELILAAKAIWKGDFDKIDLQNSEEMLRCTKALDLARLDPELGPKARLLISTYLQTCLFPTQLWLDPSQMTSTAQDIPMMFSKADAMGGTFGFSATWNLKQKRIPDRSSDETVLAVLQKEQNQTCYILPKEIDEGIALLDIGAHYRGISNEEVAKQLLSSLKKRGFDSILFFKDRQLSVLSEHYGIKSIEDPDREGVKRALDQLKLVKPFTYYDHGSCIGQDLELPEGVAWVTFSDTVGIDSLLQTVTRCRLLVEGHHSVRYLIPSEMNDGLWTGDRVVETAKAYQDKIEKKANFHAICEQMRASARIIIDQKMRSTADYDERQLLQDKASSLLMEGQSNDLVALFGALQEVVRSNEALQKLKNSLIEQISKILPEAKELLTVELEKILQWHKENKTQIPKWVRLGDEKDEAIREVVVSKMQERLRMMEEEYERMTGSRTPKQEVAWNRLNPDAIIANSTDADMPTLYALRDALKERGFSAPFDDNILISSNLLSTFVGESNCLLTENQKPLHRCLFLRKQQKLVLVTEGDAASLKKQLVNSEKDGVYLVEPSGVINQRSSRNEAISNLWHNGTQYEKGLLLQALLFQGAAMQLDRLPLDQVKKPLSEFKGLFEAALRLRPDDLIYYKKHPHLKRLFSRSSMPLQGF